MSSCLFCASLCPRKFTFVGGQVKKLSVENDNPPSPTSAFNFGKDSVIKEQLKVIFTLKNILGIEHDQLCAFLGSFGKLHPEFWISVCPSCEETVGKYFEVVKEVERLEKVLANLSNELKGKIWKSKDEEGQGPTVMLWDTIRSQTLMAEDENLFDQEVEEEPVISELQSSSSTQGSHLESDPESPSISDSATKIVVEKKVKEEEEKPPDDDDQFNPGSTQQVSNDEIEINQIIEEASNLFEEEWHLEQKENVNDVTQASVRTMESEPEADLEAATRNETKMTVENNGIFPPSNLQSSVFVRLRDVLTETPTAPLRPSSSTPNEVAKRSNLRSFVQRRSKVPRMKEKEPPSPQLSPNQTDKPTKSMLFKKMLNCSGINNDGEFSAHSTAGLSGNSDTITPKFSHQYGLRNQSKLPRTSDTSVPSMSATKRVVLNSMGKPIRTCVRKTSKRIEQLIANGAPIVEYDLSNLPELKRQNDVEKNPAKSVKQPSATKGMPNKINSKVDSGTCSAKKKFVCWKCPFESDRRNNLSRHLEDKHSNNEVVYACKELVDEQPCGLRFISKRYLVDHIKTHAKDFKPLKCETCGDEFMSRQCLGGHERKGRCSGISIK